MPLEKSDVLPMATSQQPFDIRKVLKEDIKAKRKAKKDAIRINKSITKSEDKLARETLRQLELERIEEKRIVEQEERLRIANEEYKVLKEKQKQEKEELKIKQKQKQEELKAKEEQQKQEQKMKEDIAGSTITNALNRKLIRDKFKKQYEELKIKQAEEEERLRIKQQKEEQKIKEDIAGSTITNALNRKLIRDKFKKQYEELKAKEEQQKQEQKMKEDIAGSTITNALNRKLIRDKFNKQYEELKIKQAEEEEKLKAKEEQQKANDLKKQKEKQSNAIGELQVKYKKFKETNKDIYDEYYIQKENIEDDYDNRIKNKNATIAKYEQEIKDNTLSTLGTVGSLFSSKEETQKRKDKIKTANDFIKKLKAEIKDLQFLKKSKLTKEKEKLNARLKVASGVVQSSKVFNMKILRTLKTNVKLNDKQRKEYLKKESDEIAVIEKPVANDLSSLNKEKDDKINRINIQYQKDIDKLNTKIKEEEKIKKDNAPSTLGSLFISKDDKEEKKRKYEQAISRIKQLEKDIKIKERDNLNEAKKIEQAFLQKVENYNRNINDIKQVIKDKYKRILQNISRVDMEKTDKIIKDEQQAILDEEKRLEEEEKRIIKEKAIEKIRLQQEEKKLEISREIEDVFNNLDKELLDDGDYIDYFYKARKLLDKYKIQYPDLFTSKHMEIFKAGNKKMEELRIWSEEREREETLARQAKEREERLAKEEREEIIARQEKERKKREEKEERERLAKEEEKKKDKQKEIEKRRERNVKERDKYKEEVKEREKDKKDRQKEVEKIITKIKDIDEEISPLYYTQYESEKGSMTVLQRTKLYDKIIKLYNKYSDLKKELSQGEFRQLEQSYPEIESFATIKRDYIVAERELIKQLEKKKTIPEYKTKEEVEALSKAEVRDLLIAFNVLTDEGLIYANVPPTDTKGRKDIRWAYNAYNRKFNTTK